MISQVGKLVYGETASVTSLFYALQAGTMLILVLAANTSFADFPGSPRSTPATTSCPASSLIRGHRLVFSNGIIFLAGAAIVTLLATGGEVSRLIPLYAIGVFTSFTLSQPGMAKHHITHKEPTWKRGLVINGIGALLSLLVLVIVAAVKFREGAWVIIVLVPIMVYGRRAAQPDLRGRRRRVARGRPGACRGAHDADPRGRRAGRQPRRSDGPAIQYAARSSPTTCAPCTSTSTRGRPSQLVDGVGRPRLHPVPARHRRVPRSADAPRRARAGRADDGGPRHRADDPDPPPRVHQALASPAPRPVVERHRRRAR